MERVNLTKNVAPRMRGRKRHDPFRGDLTELREHVYVHFLVTGTRRRGQ